MNQNVLKYFYRFDGSKNQFIKSYFIRVIRNRIIDPNTKFILDRGFKFYDNNLNDYVDIPCDDSNWCEYQTFNEGFKLNVLQLPFTIKLHKSNFYSIESIDDFNDIFSRIIDFRVNTIKKGWALKYGFEYNGEKYDLLENLSEEQLLTWKDPRQNILYSLDNITEDMLR